MALAEPYTPGSFARRFRRASTERLWRVGWLDKAAIASLIGITIVILITPLVAPHRPSVPIGDPFRAPGGGAWMGTDWVGRDILTRTLYGMRLSLIAALVVIASGVVVGGLVGLIAGAAGGWMDSLLMRITDVFLALPAPVLAIAVVAALGPSFEHTLVAVAIVWWPFYARIVRGEIRAIAARPHMEAARLAGTSRFRLYFRHLLPGAVPAILVTASLDVGGLVLTLAGLSFLGLGAPEPAPELGAMAAQGLPYLLSYWWVPVFPALAVFFLAFVANLAGDGLRDLLNE